MKPVVGPKNVEYVFSENNTNAKMDVLASTLSDELPIDVSTLGGSCVVPFYVLENGKAKFSAPSAVNSDAHAISTGSLSFTPDSISITVGCGYSIRFCRIAIQNLSTKLSEKTPIEIPLDSLESVEFNYTVIHPVLDAATVAEMIPESKLAVYDDSRVYISEVGESILFNIETGGVETLFENEGVDKMEKASKVCESAVRNQSALTNVSNPYDDFIPTQWLAPLIEKHGTDAINAWNGISLFLFDREKLFGPNPRVASLMQDIKFNKRIEIVSDIFRILQHEVIPVEEVIMDKYEAFRRTAESNSKIVATDNINLFRSRFESGTTLRELTSQTVDIEFSLSYNTIEENVEQGDIWRINSPHTDEEIVIRLLKKTPLVSEDVLTEMILSYGGVEAARTMFWVPVVWEASVIGFPERDSSSIVYVGSTDDADHPVYIPVTPDHLQTGELMDSYTDGKNVVRVTEDSGEEEEQDTQTRRYDPDVKDKLTDTDKEAETGTDQSSSESDSNESITERLRQSHKERIESSESERDT